jgi:hypothetical protein
MPMRRLLLAVLLLSVLLAGLVPSSAAASAEQQALTACFSHFAGYVRSVGAGDLERAATFWRPSDLEAASRLGIAHPREMLLKVDSDSPLWAVQPTLLDSVRADYTFGPPVRLQSGPLAGNVTIVLQVHGDDGRRTKQYLFQPDGEGGWLLASRARWIAEQGPGTPGRFVRVFERRPGMPWSLPPHLVADLDAAVETMAGRLELSPDRLAVLEREKLDYLLAAPPVVAYLAGGPTVGVANLQVDMVVTHHPHHAHELAHLLVNAWLGEPPLWTIPLLQEGLSTHLGGRWGRSARVLDRVGRQALQSGLVTLDELLAAADFRVRSADLTYAPAGVFAGFLREVHGADGLRDAYLAVSGTADEVGGWSAAEVRRRLGEALGMPWEEVAAAFAAHVAAPDGPAGLRPAPARWPGDDGGTDVLLRSPRHVVRGGAGADEVLRLEFTAAAGAVDAAILIGGATGGDAAEEAAGSAGNPLFAEHFPGRTYRGETHALIVDRHEARLYDYRRLTLVALHSEGFWPGDAAAPFARRDGSVVAVEIAGDVAPPRDGWTLVDRAP